MTFLRHWFALCFGLPGCVEGWCDARWIRENPEEPQGCNVGLYRRAGKRLVAQECNEQRDFLDDNGGSANGKLEGKHLVFVPACPVHLHCRVCDTCCLLPGTVEHLPQVR